MSKVGSMKRNKISLKRFPMLAYATILSCAVMSSVPAYAENYSATLDTLYANGSSSIQSAYQLTETDLTSGTNVFKIGDKYFF